MKKILVILLVCLLLLAGCGKTNQAGDGSYFTPAGLSGPYLRLLPDGHGVIIDKTATSYLPCGLVERTEGGLILKGEFANEPFRYVFTLTADDTLRFDAKKSTFALGGNEWADGLVFTRDPDFSAVDAMVKELKSPLEERFAAYFGLDASNGLDVIVWQMGPEGYSFGLLEHREEARDRFDTALLRLKSASAEQMKEILAMYGVEEDRIFIIPWQNPISSYIADIWVVGEDEDAKTDEYIANVRKMLFD